MKRSSESGSRRCAVDVDVLGPERALHGRRRETASAARRRTRRSAVGPLHRSSARRSRPSADELLAHADLLAVEEHRRARAARTAGCTPSGSGGDRRRASAAAGGAGLARRSACPGRDRRPRTPPRAPLGELVEGQLVVVAHERGPLRVLRERRAVRASASARGRASARASDRYRCCMPMKSKSIVQLVAVLVAEEAALLGVGQVHLAEQDGVAACGGRGTPAARAGTACGSGRSDGRRRAATSMRNGTASTRKPDTPSSSQKPITLAISSRTAGLVDVEVGLVLVEAVQVVLAGLLVPLPEARLLVGEGDVARLGLRRVVAPHVPVAVRRGRGSPGPTGTTGAGRRCG